MSLYGETQSVRVLSTCGGGGMGGRGSMGDGGVCPHRISLSQTGNLPPHRGGGSPQRLKEEIFTSMFKSQA